MTNISTLAQSLKQIQLLKSQQLNLEELSTQLASGKITDRYSELKTDAILSLRSRANISSIDTYINNIKNADRHINTMTLALEEIQTQAGNISNALTVSHGQGDFPELEGIQDLANNTYNFLLDLINTQESGRYIFGGADTGTQPITDTGLLESFLGEFVPDESDLTNPPLTASGIVGQWGSGAITTDQFIAAYRNVNETTLGYSSALVNDEAGNVYARIDDNKQLDYTVLADSEGIKELVIAISVLRELPPVEYAPGALNDPTATTLSEDVAPFPPAEKQENFYQVLNDLVAFTAQAINKIDPEIFKLSQAQAQIDQKSQSLQQERNLYANIVGEIEDADITEVAAKLSIAQVQLEASYSVTATVSQLSLSNFLF